MLNKIFGVFTCLALAVIGYAFETATAADTPKPVDMATITPPDLVANTPKGQLKNPYKDTQADIVKEGEHIYLSYSCNGCHGGGGGGGMCPPLINDVWVYGGDDDTLFRLIVLGSDGLQKVGYMRKGKEGVVGPMPPMGSLLKNADELWKVIAFIRSKYSPSADPNYKYGDPPDQN